MTLKERDKKHLWHPLTQHQIHPEALPIIRAKGALLYDEEGKTYIDGISSWYTAMYGHVMIIFYKRCLNRCRILIKLYLRDLHINQQLNYLKN